MAPRTLFGQFQKSNSRKPAVPKVATHRILTQVGEYPVQIGPPVAGCMRACSELSTPCMNMQTLVVVVRGIKRAGAVRNPRRHEKPAPLIQLLLLPMPVHHTSYHCRRWLVL